MSRLSTVRRVQQQPSGRPAGRRMPSPMLVGAAIGLLNVASFALRGKGVGVSSAFESAASLAERTLAPDLTRVNAYVRERSNPPKIDDETWFVLGTLLGGVLVSGAARSHESAAAPRLTHEPFRRSRLASHAAEPSSDPTPAPSVAQAVAGGALVMLGARIAEGCTSGHGLSGTAQGALSSWIFTPAMFGLAVLLRPFVAARRRPRPTAR